MSLVPIHLQKLLENKRYEEVFDLLLPEVSPKASTRANTLSGWRNYVKWLEEAGGWLVEPGRPEEHYLDWLKAQNAAPSTLNNRLLQVRKLYGLLLDKGVVGHNPFAGKRMQYNPVEERRQVYSRQEVDCLLAHATSEERLMVLLGSEAGLSGGEVRLLKFSHVIEDGAALQIWRVRYRDMGFSPVQVIFCSATLQKALQQWTHERGAAPLYGVIPDGYLFEKDGRNIFDHELLAMLYRLCQKANVDYKPWRALRHVAGIQKLVAGEERWKIQSALGVQRLDPLLKKAGAEDARKSRWKKR